MKYILTQKDLNNFVKSLRKNNMVFHNPTWIDNRYFYLSDYAKLMGFDCTQHELDNAKEDGFIKKAKGVDLYLTRSIASFCK